MLGHTSIGPSDARLGRLPIEQPDRGSPAACRTGENGLVTSPETILDPRIADLLKRDDAGLVTAVIQQHDSNEVLMVGWMDDEALRRTLTTGRTTFWSRSRQQYWVKGETSGNRQWVREVRLDCDGDTLLVRVDQEGPACHTGTRTCFDDRLLPAMVVAR
ncbi:MAG: phosphoribosyl-AMP cyclohydrolase [Microlunatus sp.]|nr:phosphoribosyl-AMP cyclohydrolase [Microlunatus sp.]